MRVDKIGFELEMGAKERRDIEGFDMTYDGSVRTRRGIAVEYVSEPFVSAADLIEAFRRLKENIKEINESMGLHIHISMRDETDYRYLMTEKFFSFFVARIMEYAAAKNDKRLLKRLDNNFCKGSGLNGSYIDSQFSATSKECNRYYAVNFAHNLHGTIEFRIFPAVRYITKIKDYVRLVISAVEDFLESTDVLKEIRDAVIIEEVESEVVEV